MRRGFLDELHVSPLQDGSTWVLTRRFRWQNGHEYEVPAFFVTDFASIPRAMWGIPGFSPVGRHLWAAVVHDWLYWSHGVPRAEADKALLDGMRDAGERLVVRWAIYAAVRIFGGLAWWSNGKARERGVDRVLSAMPTRWTKLPPTGLERHILALLGRDAE